MDYGAIATLIACGATVLVNIIILCVNLHVQIKRDKVNGRVFPVVSLWHNGEDKIDYRLKKSNDRVFFDKKLKKDFCAAPYIFFAVRNTGSQNMTNCNVEVRFCGETDRTEEYRIGAISRGSTIIIPAKIYYGYKRLKCTIDYCTDAGEAIVCIAEANIDFSDRSDHFVVTKRPPIQYGKQYELNTRLTQSFPACEFFDDETFSFEFHATGARDDAT